MERGLVLCGGGSLGAYEAGAYRYLVEKGMTFSVMTGSSIGALNAAMFAQGRLEENLEIWKNITIKAVIRNGVNLGPSLLKGFSRETRKEIMNYAADYLWYGGGDVAPLVQLIEDNVDPERLRSSGVKVGIVTVRFPTLEEVDILLNEVSDELMKEFLVASAACYPVLPIKWIRGKAYLDGGYRNNLPIDYALRLGAEEVIAIELHGWPKVPQHPELRNLPFVTLISPSHRTGSFFDFERNAVDANIQLGYLDAKKALGDSLGHEFAFHKGRAILSYAKELTAMLVHRGHIYDYHKIQEALSYRDFFPQTEEDLVLRAAEMVGAWCGIPYLREYEFRPFLRQCEKRILEHKKTLKTTSFFKLHRNCRRIQEKHRLDLLACLYQEAKEGSHLLSYEELTRQSPEVAPLIAFFLILKEKGII